MLPIDDEGFTKKNGINFQNLGLQRLATDIPEKICHGSERVLKSTDIVYFKRHISVFYFYFYRFTVNSENMFSLFPHWLIESSCSGNGEIKFTTPCSV